MPLVLPGDEKKILLHSCCAPCSCSIIDKLLCEGITPTLFFYNPNIHPLDEYSRRKKELVRYAWKRGVVVLDADYEPEKWRHMIEGYEKEPERGMRCSICFELRLLKTAQIACQNGFRVISSSLGFSRKKDFVQVTEAGRRAVQMVKDISYFEYNWRKGEASLRSCEIAREENFYRQTYCGCFFSKNSNKDFF